MSQSVKDLKSRVLEGGWSGMRDTFRELRAIRRRWMFLDVGATPGEWILHYEPDPGRRKVPVRNSGLHIDYSEAEARRWMVGFKPMPN